jgi:hypothetical protein
MRTTPTTLQTQRRSTCFDSAEFFMAKAAGVVLQPAPAYQPPPPRTEPCARKPYQASRLSVASN